MVNLSRPIVLTSYLLSSILLLPTLCQAESQFIIVINEIAWMGTKTSYNDEWLELYNNTDSQINLSGWQIIAADGDFSIILSGIIPAGGFYLLERSNDDTLPDILADQIYSGAMGNNGESLFLYDNSKNIIDSVDCSAGWFAGDNAAKQTMERKNPLSPGNLATNWQTGKNAGGTPKNNNSPAFNKSDISGFTENQNIISEIQNTNKQKMPRERTTYAGGIIFSKILPSPDGPDAQEEWIEIYNKNNFEADISGWKISDTAGVTSTYVFPEKTKIEQLGAVKIGRPETKIILNNNQDGLNLRQPDGTLADSATYQNAEKGIIYELIDGRWVWDNNKETKNSDQDKLVLGQEAKSATESVQSSGKKQLISARNNLEIKETPLKIFGTALFFAVISGASILIIKNKSDRGLE
jgi:hypothetical protein